MTALRRVLIVRHGETPWNAERRWQGWQDIPLSETGRTQARALGRRLHGSSFDVVAASSLARSRETAELATGMAPTLIDPDLREISYGEWEGVRDVELHERWPELRATWGLTPDRMTLPGGESLAGVVERAWPAFLALLDRGEGDVLLVAHGGVNRLLLGGLLGLPLGAFWRLSQDPTGVSVIELPLGPAHEAVRHARVRLVNCTAHLL